MGVFDEELRTAWNKLPKEKQDELLKQRTGAQLELRFKPTPPLIAVKEGGAKR